MDEFDNKIDLIKNEITKANEAGDVGYSKSLQNCLNITQSSLRSLQDWYSSLNEIFGIIGFGIAVGIYGIYLNGKFLVALLMSFAAIIILIFNSIDKGRKISPFMTRIGKESKDDARARKFFKNVVIGSTCSWSYWRSTLPYFIGVAAIFLVGAISFYSLKSAFVDCNENWERAINPLASITAIQIYTRKCNGEAL